MHKKSLLMASFVVFLLSSFTNILSAQENTLVGNAMYLERIALPPNAVFEVTLEDVSLMDVASVTLGSTRIDPSGNIPIAFTIKYNTDDIKLGRSYNVRGRITVDGQLWYITDTMHPVLTGKNNGGLTLIMKRIQRR